MVHFSPELFGTGKSDIFMHIIVFDFQNNCWCGFATSVGSESQNPTKEWRI